MSRSFLIALVSVVALGIGVTSATAAHLQTNETGCNVTNGNDVFSGGQGADTCNLRDGNDFYQGREGDDLLGENNLSSGNDEIIGGKNQDRVFGGDDDDFVRGGDGDDTVGGIVPSALALPMGTGGDDGNDTLLGNGGQDNVSDIFENVADEDNLQGNGGNDRVDGDDDDNEDVIDGGEGTDNCFADLTEPVLNCETVSRA